MGPNKGCIPAVLNKNLFVNNTIGCTDEIGKLERMAWFNVPMQPIRWQPNWTEKGKDPARFTREVFIIDYCAFLKSLQNYKKLSQNYAGDYSRYRGFIHELNLKLWKLERRIQYCERVIKSTAKTIQSDNWSGCRTFCANEFERFFEISRVLLFKFMNFIGIFSELNIKL